MTVTGNRLQDRVAVVTGGGRGIGQAIVRQLAKEGAIVASCGRTLSVVEQTLAAVDPTGQRSFARSVDVSDETAITTFIDDVAKKFGSIDILVNNAALTAASEIGFAELVDMTTEEWSRVLGVNLNGAFYASRAVGRIMRAQKRGTIINISSVHARVPNAETPHYDAAKAAIEALTRNQSVALGPYGIRVNAIAPGPIDVRSEGEVFTAEQRATTESWTALGRFGRPEEIGAVAAFLASDEASYITGQSIVVDGGFLIKHGGMAKSND